MLALILALALQTSPVDLDSVVFIGCATPEQRYTIATGFPVHGQLVMTAKHAQCDADGEMYVRYGVQVFDVESAGFSGNFDMQVLFIPDANFPVTDLRAPVLGEEVRGYGSPYGGILSFGRVVQVTNFAMLSTNYPIPGMSGSPLFGEDGRIVGMVIAAVGEDHSVLTGALTGDLVEEQFLLFPLEVFGLE